MAAGADHPDGQLEGAADEDHDVQYDDLERTVRREPGERLAVEEDIGKEDGRDGGEAEGDGEERVELVADRDRQPDGDPQVKFAQSSEETVLPLTVRTHDTQRVDEARWMK